MNSKGLRLHRRGKIRAGTGLISARVAPKVAQVLAVNTWIPEESRR